MSKQKNSIKKLSILGSLFLAATLFSGCTDENKDMSEWKTQVEADLNSLDHDFKQLKAELKGDDMEAAKQEALSEVEEIRTEIENKLEKAKNATKEEVTELKKEIKTAMSNLKQKMSSRN